MSGEPGPRKPPMVTAGSLVKLALLSLMVGILLAIFGIEPAAVWRAIASMARGAARIGLDLLDWGIGYILIGAGVVVPIYAGRLLWRRFRTRRR